MFVDVRLRGTETELDMHSSPSEFLMQLISAKVILKESVQWFLNYWSQSFRRMSCAGREPRRDERHCVCSDGHVTWQTVSSYRGSRVQGGTCPAGSQTTVTTCLIQEVKSVQKGAFYLIVPEPPCQTHTRTHSLSLIISSHRVPMWAG